jgi:hypothetical protein
MIQALTGPCLTEGAHRPLANAGPISFRKCSRDYPGDAFEGKVSQIRMNPTKTTDRTSYTVVVATNNSRGMLPYLTAKLHFEAASCVNAQLTPKGLLPAAKSLETPPGKVLASR